MTPIDADLPEHERQAMLAEVKSYLPAFLSGAATMRRAMLNDVKLLLDLNRSDLEDLLSVHTALSEQAVALVAELDVPSRRPWSGSSRTTLSTARRATGAVDWMATTARRSQAGHDPTLFAARVSRPATDVAENRVLVWVVRELTRRIARARRATHPTNADAAHWRARLDALHESLKQIGARPWIAAAPDSGAPNHGDLHRVARSRSPFHRVEVLAAAQTLLRADDPSPNAITETLCRVYFEPDRTADLFELVVALRLLRELGEPKYGLTARPARLVRGANRADEYATYDLPRGAGSVAVLFQRWPFESGRSVRRKLAETHALSAQPPRPDIVLVRRSGSVPPLLTDALVLELKASRRAAYLNEGLGQLLAYRGDYPHLFPKEPGGWLVAPPSDAFTRSPATDSTPLWITDHDEVAAAAVRRILA